MFLMKFSLYFTLSYLILAFPINNDTIFDRMHEHTAPITTKVYDYLSLQLNKLSMNDEIKVIKEKSTSYTDKLKSKFSGISKNEKLSIQQDSYTNSEKNLLQKITN
jgi:hypothetical protein